LPKGALEGVNVVEFAAWYSLVLGSSPTWAPTSSRSNSRRTATGGGAAFPTTHLTLNAGPLLY
jgi:hypothetical protein